MWSNCMDKFGLRIQALSKSRHTGGVHPMTARDPCWSPRGNSGDLERAGRLVFIQPERIYSSAMGSPGSVLADEKQHTNERLEVIFE